MNIADILLQEFEPDMAKQLIAFGQKLSKIDVDIFVFLARKSLCLYDVLLKLGATPIESVVVSDRILDMRLDPFRDKRVALVDDTLILGTSLARAKASLERAGAHVSTHVFCLDQRWHCPDLIVPDSIAVETSDDRIMTFCTAEVRAMSIMPRPYLVDFPLSRPFRLKAKELDCLLAQTGWKPMKLSTQLQERHGVATLTFFPSSETMTELHQALGNAVFECLDLVKARVWARRGRDSWVVQIVPIVTLRPMTERTLAKFNQYLLDTVLGQSKAANTLVLASVSGKSQQRLCQFILSAAIGHRFMAGINTRVGRELHLGFDPNETDRHFGPWHHDQMAELTQKAPLALLDGKAAPPAFRLKPAAIPASVRKWAKASIGKSSKPLRRRPDSSIGLLANFAEAFSHIYDKREIPAREEARREVPRLGVNYLDPDRPMPHRDRLQKGVPWQVLVERLTRLCGVSKSAHVMQIFSLLLDLCNDVGIAVPVTCVEENIVYRGYRHGEDVKFSEGELALAYDVAEGFLETSGLTTIPRLTFEKLLVLLIKVGATHGFLEVLYGATGTDGICKIGFDLKGARPLLSRGPSSRAERDLWLTDYLVQRGVVRAPRRANRHRGEYELGDRPQGNYIVSHAPDDAKNLGNIMGMLLRNARGRPTVIDEKALVLLTTCATPAHSAKALQVELGILRDWYETVGDRVLAEVQLNDPKSVANALELIVTSRGHEALHSARDKFVGFKKNKCGKIIESAAKTLAAQSPLFKRLWNSYWKPLQQATLTEELKTFSPLIDQAASLCWNLAACLSAAEIALRYHQVQQRVIKNNNRLSAAFSKLRKYRSEMRATGLPEPRQASRISERFEKVEALNQTEFRFDSGELVCAKATSLPDAMSAFKPQEALNYSRREIAQLGSEINSLIDLIEPLYSSWGKKADRVDFSHMVYYDIVDSTATLAARRGQDTEDHRRRCQQLKEHVNRWFDRSIGEALRFQDIIYPINGNKGSTNDCKHVFLRGINARGWAEKMISMLVSAADTFDMRVRIYVVPCSFVGTLVYRQGLDPEIKGTRFWEHWSRLAKKCAGYEPKEAANFHFLLVATEELNGRLQILSPLTWINTTETTVDSEIEFLSRQTLVRYGQLTA